MEGETEGVIQGTELVALPLWARPSLWPQPGQGPALECGAGILFQSPLSAAGDMGISHFKIPKPPRSHWPLQLLWLLVPVPTPLCPRLGWGREGEAGCPSGGGGVRFLCMESYVYLGREMPVATWAYVFGWCSYTPEPMQLETCVMACGLGGEGSRDVGRAGPHGAVPLETHYLGSKPSSIAHWLCNLNQVTAPL